MAVMKIYLLLSVSQKMDREAEQGGSVAERMSKAAVLLRLV